MLSMPSERVEARGEARAHRSESADPDDPKWFTPAFKVSDGMVHRASQIAVGPAARSGALVSAENPLHRAPPSPSTRGA